MILPPEATPLLGASAPIFTRPTSRRFDPLLVAAILTRGRHTVANPLRALGRLAPGHRTDSQRASSRARRSGLRLGCASARFLRAHVVPDGPVLLVGDDTVDGHPGRHVHGEARHRDPARSSHAYAAWKSGHRRVVPAVLARSPWAGRPRALPILVDLYRSEEGDRGRRRPHRPPAQLMGRLPRVPPIRFPDRTDAPCPWATPPTGPTRSPASSAGIAGGSC